MTSSDAYRRRVNEIEFVLRKNSGLALKDTEKWRMLAENVARVNDAKALSKYTRRSIFKIKEILNDQNIDREIRHMGEKLKNLKKIRDMMFQRLNITNQIE